MSISRPDQEFFLGNRRVDDYTDRIQSQPLPTQTDTRVLTPIEKVLQQRFQRDPDYKEAWHQAEVMLKAEKGVKQYDSMVFMRAKTIWTEIRTQRELENADYREAVARARKEINPDEEQAIAETAYKYWQESKTVSQEAVGRE